jgi:hypothetical protein
MLKGIKERAEGQTAAPSQLPASAA